MKRIRGLVALCSVALILSHMAQINGFGGINLSQSYSAETRLDKVGILIFQDESGMNTPPDFGQKIAQLLQQKLALNHKGLLPRLISAGEDVSSIKYLSLDQLVALGKQSGVRLVVRGGLLALSSESAGEDLNVAAQLYAEIISVDDGDVISLLAEGTGTQKGPGSGAIQFSSLDINSGEFQSSALGRALSSSIEQLAAAIHQAIISPAGASASNKQPQDATRASQSPNQIDPAQIEAANTAGAEEELQQLISQAESLLSNSASSSAQSLASLSQALESLKSSLASKASLLEQGKDTIEVDQGIAALKEELQSAILRVTQEVTSSESDAEPQTPSGEKKNILDRVNEYADQALSLIQKIQEIRTTLRSIRGEPTYPLDQSTEEQQGQENVMSDQSVPSEEATGEITGAVTENDKPLGGVLVTELETGETATTDSDGVYSLKNILILQMATLTLTKGGKQIASRKVEAAPEGQTVADFSLKSSSGGGLAAGVRRIIPPNVFVNSVQRRGGNGGMVKGIARDPVGKPMARALVTLKGMGLARTDSQGQFAFMNVPSGTHQLTIRKSGFNIKSEQIQVMSKKSSEANIRFGINDRIERARKIERGIEKGANTVLTGAVFDSQNHPLVGAKVLLIQSGRVLSVRTGPNGVYKVRNVNPGLYRLVLSGIGYEGSNQMVDLKSGGTERRDFTLRKKNSPLIEKLIKNEMASRGEIRGSVHAPNLAPISNAVVELQALARPSFTARTLTDSRGEYVFKVFEGSYQVKAYLGVFQTEPQMVSVRAGVSARADFALKQKVISERGRGPSEILVRSGQLKGCIIDSTTRKPVPGAIVSVQGQRSVRSDREGNYFVMKLAPGSYQVIVSSPGFQQQEKTVMIRADSSTAQDYLLRSEFRESSPNKPSSIIPRAQSRGIPIRNGQVRGQITNARSGRPIAGATVSISGGQSEASNQNGFYAITNLPPGTYRITIRKSGFSDSGGITTIRGGETVMENFRLNLRLDPLTPRGVLNPRLLKKR